MPCGWEGNRRSGVALAMRHRLQWFIHLRAHGLRQGDGHPAYALLWSMALNLTVNTHTDTLYYYLSIFCREMAALQYHLAGRMWTPWSPHPGWDVTSAGWQVTLCDPMRHVSSNSGVATLRTAIHLLLTYLLPQQCSAGSADETQFAVFSA